ncbi:MAG: hypothetical protein NTW94_06335 [Legionellales bacterium]|nr:hypothetical protein [Legionellales bacterium]
MTFSNSIIKMGFILLSGWSLISTSYAESVTALLAPWLSYTPICQINITGTAATVTGVSVESYTGGACTTGFASCSHWTQGQSLPITPSETLHLDQTSLNNGCGNFGALSCNNGATGIKVTFSISGSSPVTTCTTISCSIITHQIAGCGSPMTVTF